MSAILSVDDLNDFISPGVACIKPVETLPPLALTNPNASPYEVTTEDQLPPAADAPPASISLTDCLACSGCVTSAEAVLVSLQSHSEVASTLEKYHSLKIEQEAAQQEEENGRIFVASVSPQTRASLAALYGVREREAGHMIEQLLAGPQGLKSTGTKGSGFTWVIDTNTLGDMCKAGVVEEALGDVGKADAPKRPILASACPGWVCYAEKMHPYVLPHISRIKSPQALTGVLVKSVLSRRFGIAPDKIWHMAVMPCFDKKLEASREELTDFYWRPGATEKRGVRDVDCVITARELLMLAEMKGIDFSRLPRTAPVHILFPDSSIDRVLFPRGLRREVAPSREVGSSGGYAYEVVKAQQQRLPGSIIRIERGRNMDVVEYVLTHDGATVMKTARYYGFRNIQNLVRKLKPAKRSRMPAAARRAETSVATCGGAALTEYAYVEVMACPGGCTNGGGQIKVGDVAGLRGEQVADVGSMKRIGTAEQKEWLSRVDEAYYSGESDGEGEARSNGHEVDTREDDHDGSVAAFLRYWSSSTSIPLEKLLMTSYRQVDSDVGKDRGGSDMDRVAGLASSIGGGW